MSARPLLPSAFLVAVASLAGCMSPAANRCGELYCPSGTVCSPNGDRCVTSAAISACDGKLEQDPCSMPGMPSGQCRNGVCVSVVCGDGIVAGDEVCDDGNTLSCDGCSADCRSDESCGNGVVDSTCGEDC